MDTWNAVQEINEQVRQSAASAAPRLPSLFSGLLRCADCGGSLSAQGVQRTGQDDKKTTHYSYQCARFVLSGRNVCSNHSIREEALIQLVRKDIRRHAQQITLDRERVAREVMARQKTIPQPDTAEAIRRLDKLLRDTQQKQARLYEDKVCGSISQQTFSMLTEECEAQRSAVEQERQCLLEEQAENKKSALGFAQWAEQIKDYGEIEEIDRALLTALIDHIVVSAPVSQNGDTMQNIQIGYKFLQKNK